jgi:hypothetical protein
MAKFLSGKELENAVYDVIYEAKKKLLIISPYIKLDDYFRKKLFDKHLGNADLMIVIVFGKNENHINKSFNKDDFEYFKKFPNISIVYAPNLHAKYYANEKQSIITSINLYDTSFKNNIEFGVISEPTLLGIEKMDSDSWQKSMEILTENNVVFVRKPNFRKKLLVIRDYVGSDTVYDVTQQLIETGRIPKKCVFDLSDPELLEAIKNETRVSREEFEQQQKQDFVSKRKEESDLTGNCIRCKRPIKVNIKSPFCTACYSDWKKNGYESKLENYCHICGKKHSSTMKKPACYSCYMKPA